MSTLLPPLLEALERLPFMVVTVLWEVSQIMVVLDRRSLLRLRKHLEVVELLAIPMTRLPVGHLTRDKASNTMLLNKAAKLVLAMI
jgi:hypothetical protein